MNDKNIIQGVGLIEILREQLQNAFLRQEIATTELAEFYLVSLLHQFHESEESFGHKGPDVAEKPLAVLFMEASSGDVTTKIRCLKKLGDTALVIAGFYADRIRRSLMGLSYYTSMGGAAYGHLAHLHADELLIAKLYSELSSKFTAFAEAISIVAPWNRATSNSDLVNIYERWLATGDDKLEELLKEGGICTDAITRPS